jgi:hypothetical protein
VVQLVLLERKVQGTTGLVVQLVWAQGIQGVAGATGTTGATGLSGATGPRIVVQLVLLGTRNKVLLG